MASRRTGTRGDRVASKAAIGAVFLLAMAACTSLPTPSPSTSSVEVTPTASPTAASPTASPTAVRPTSTPRVVTPSPTPRFVRFDIVNGPRAVIVWMTSDRGAEAHSFLPGERRTLFVPLFEGTDLAVYVDDCVSIASLDWLPGAIPSTILLAEDPDGPGYTITVVPGNSGTPVPQGPWEGTGCSG